MRTNRVFGLGSLLALSMATVLLWPSTASANAIALSQVVFNWTGFTFVTTGSLTVTQRDPVSSVSSSANTTLGGTSSEYGNGGFNAPANWSNTFAASGYSSALGSAYAQGSTLNGLMLAASQASTTSPQSNKQEAQSTASNFFLNYWYMTGVGSLIMSIPYTLYVECSTSSVYETAVATASVSFYAEEASASCTGTSSSSKNGILSASLFFNNPLPWHGMLMGFMATANTSAMVKVSEPSTVSLAVIGLISVMVSAAKHRKRGARAV